MGKCESNFFGVFNFLLSSGFLKLAKQSHPIVIRVTCIDFYYITEFVENEVERVFSVVTKIKTPQ